MSIQPRWWFSLLLLAALHAAVWAQFDVTGTVVGWSDGCPMMYVRLHARNTSDRAVKTDVRLMNFGDGRRILTVRDQTFAPATERDLHVAIPMSGGWMQLSYYDPFRGRDESTGVSTPGQMLLLHVSGPERQLTQSELETYSKSFTAAKGLSHYGSNSIISQITPDQLPDQWQCYLPFLTVVMPEHVYTQLGPEPRERLLEWVRAGGDLTLYDAEQEGKSALLLGRLSRVKLNPIASGAIDSDWSSERQVAKQLILNLDRDLYVGEIKGGKAGGLILASLFFIIAGPLNLFWVWKKKRPHLLLKTVPLLSLAFCLLITITFVATEGFARKGGSFTLALLDESSQRGIAMDQHNLLSGLYPASGFQFAPTVAFFPELRNAKASCEADLQAGFHLRSGWFQPRIPFRYATVEPFETRERLVLDSARSSVTNGFETAIAAGIIKLGDLDYAIPSLRPGEKGALRPHTGPARLDENQLNDNEQQVLVAMLSMRNAEFAQAGSSLLKENSYAIKFAAPWGTSRAGLKINGPRTQVLYGRFAPEASAAEASHAAGL